MKKLIGVTIFVALLLGLGLSWFRADQAQKALKTDTIAHLESRGYQIESDVEDISVVNVGQQDRTYAVAVTFYDEPDFAYLYTYRDNSDQIRQLPVGDEEREEFSLQHLED
ncbi:hypothetical protein J2T56_000789 [Natronobacillus azotifigens]|uniref:DUF3139 domain-containing protein n=1 Tax=Natronobacillus azotifigens TaxID=472978 RepID=A0A9J6RA37_9BACI|nr:hypothetical protein [Natronobacillus azotifigens]MCZ0702546.1 hypothetical protein [Natronobacillus azotifigens]